MLLSGQVFNHAPSKAGEGLRAWASVIAAFLDALYYFDPNGIGALNFRVAGSSSSGGRQRSFLKW